MDTFTKQYALIISNLVPGFIGLAGLVPLIPAVGHWLQPVNQGDLGFGPAIYALLAAVAVGQFISCFRWAVLDQFHQLTGLNPPAVNFGRLTEHLDALDYLAQNHFRYYEFAANGLLAVLWTYGIHRLLHTSAFLGLGTDLGIAVLSIVLFAASRDALSKYYLRSRQLLGEVAEKATLGDKMYNGIGHHEEGSHSTAVKTAPGTAENSAKPEVKAVTPAKPESGKEKTQSGK